MVYALSFRADPVKPTFVVDVSDQMDRKIEALACFTSQFEGIAGIGEVRPAGDRPLFDQIRAVMAGYGALIKAPYGEPYWTDETQELATLGSARVPTF